MRRFCNGLVSVASAAGLSSPVAIVPRRRPLAGSARKITAPSCDSCWPSTHPPPAMTS
jgi:hypothetical protein